MTHIFISLKRLVGEAFSLRNLAMAVLPALFLTVSNSAPAQLSERVMGTDVSYWQSEISSGGWVTAFSTGNRKYVQIRATRGGTTGADQAQGTPAAYNSGIVTGSHRYDDSRFQQNLKRASSAGLIVGPYHFARPDVVGNTGTDEADHFMQMAGAWMRPGYMMPMFDQEANSASGADALVQFAIDFSNRIYTNTQIRPCIYINGNYSSIFQTATLSRRDQLAKPATYTPSVVGPAYPMLWDARYSDNNNPDAIPVQTGSPKYTYTLSSGYYGPWDDYGDAEPWAFWQYASTVAIPGFGDSTCDSDVSHGDIEYVRNYLIPAVWWNDSSGDWSTLANWNSGQTPVAPISAPDQAPPYETTALPTPRLPGAVVIGTTSGQSGQLDTVILERPNTNITVTLSAGTHNIRKFYMRETLNITGGSLTINYDPTYRANNLTNVLHAGPISAQFSGPVTLSGSGSLNVHTLQVDTNRIFTLGGGTLTFNAINLMPHSSTPAKIVMSGDINLNARSNVTAIIAKGAGSGSSGLIDLGGASRTFTVGNGTNDVDLSMDVPLSNGGLTKAGAGTMRLTTGNSYGSGTIVSTGRLLVNNVSGTGTGSGAVTVNGGTLGGTGTIAGAVTVNSAGTISPGASIGTLTLNSAPTFGGTNFMEIDRNGGASLADKIVLTSGTLNYGGTLVVSNIGATLVGGEVFTNFTANGGVYTGAFANTILPTPLASNLNWYLGHLTTNGTIKVNRKPIITNPITFTNEAPLVLQIPIANLIANSTDADSDAITLASINLTTTNGVILTTNSNFIFYSNYVSVVDKFNYTISDGHGGSATGTVQIAASPTARFTGQPSVNGNSVTIHFVGSPGWTYYVDRSTNLPVWLTISTNVAPANGLIDYTDDFHDLSEPPASAFYRLRWSP